VPRQLSLFSPEELAECYLHSVVVKNVRNSLKETQRRNKLKINRLNQFINNQKGKVIIFPKKFVS